MWLEIFYLFLLLIIIFLVILIFLYANFQNAVVYRSNNPNGENVTSLDNSYKLLAYGSTDASFYPALNYRSKKINGKFILSLSSSETVDIQLRVRDNSETIGDSTTYTIWKKDDFGITKIPLIFNSNELESGKSHNIQIEAKNKNTSSTATVSVHSIFVMYN